MSGEKLWSSIISRFASSGEELQTSSGLWFNAFSLDGQLFVNKSDVNTPSCKINKTRKISKNDFLSVYTLHNKMLDNKSEMKKAASAKSRNTAYIYSLIKKYENTHTEGESECESLYDPDVVSILALIVAALGALGGIPGAIALMERRKEKIESEMRESRIKDRVEHELESAIFEIRYTVKNIHRRIDNITELIHHSKNNDNYHFFESPMAFGKTPLVLNRSDFRSFQNLQDIILLDVARFYRNVSILEQVISEYPSWFYEKLFYDRNKYDLRDIIESTNHLMSNFREYSVMKFINDLQDICRRIESVGRWFMDGNY